MSDDSQIIDVTITAPDVDWLADHCRSLIEQRLAASANIIPAIRSIYRWQGEVHEGSEAYAIVHTRAGHFDEICRQTSEAHPYETAHVLAKPVINGNQDYLDWLTGQT